MLDSESHYEERRLTILEANFQKDLELFTIRPYRSKRLKGYCNRMSQDRTTALYDDNVADMLVTQGFSIEDAPRSIYKVEKLYEALSMYAPGKISKPQRCPEYSAGLSLARACFARPKDRERLDVLPFTPATISMITSNPTGSAGLTNFGCNKAESQTRALERGLQTLKGEKQPEPCIAFARTQFNDKTRLVWGYPYSMTVIEGLVAYPLIQKFKGGSTPMAFAMTSGALGTKLRVASYHKEWAYSLDMSKFDATISGELIHQAFLILQTWFDPHQIEPVSGMTVKEIFKVIERYFIHTTIVMPDSRLYLGKRHGVPSGSFFTQIIDSIVNTIIGGAISARFSLNVSKREIFVLGDDLLMWSNRKMDLDKIAKWANQTFSVRLHGSEKSNIFHRTESVHYLGRDWDHGLPSLDESEIIKRMAHPESFRRYDADPDVRQRQVEMLILAYAATYWAGWRIAHKLLHPEGMWYGNGSSKIDVNVYCYGRGDKEVNPDFLSGLQRYLRRYHGIGTTHDIPDSGYQIWL